MKIHYLHIKNYKQFSDLELDLTYPKGHPKAGEPLDKICIIGQSGTGKTNLLDIIKKSTIDFSEQPENSYLPFFEFVGKDTDDRYITTKFATKENNNFMTFFGTEKSKINMDANNKMLNNEKSYFVGVNKIVNPLRNSKSYNQQSMSNSDKTLLTSLDTERKSVEKHGISFAGSIEKFDNKIKTIDTKIDEIQNKYMISIEIDKLQAENFIDRNIININDEVNNLWVIMKEKISNYQRERSKQIELLSNKLVSDDHYEKGNYKDDLEAWEQKNENLLGKIAGDINSILKRFNLELTKIDENQQNYNGLTIKDLSNNTIIEYDDLSTGTKNLLSTFIPLKTYAPKDSIILIDEPEMSFYPDIQRQLTDLYMNVGSNNQLILATHSPLIASSFEPWEVVELKFDKDNQIYREKYYEGDNHVDNYTVDPRMLTWTGILTDVFDLKEDSNFTFREKKLMEYATLKSEIKQMTDMAEKEKSFKKLKKVSKILGIYKKK